MRSNELRRLFVNSVRSLADDLDIPNNRRLGFMIAFQGRRITNLLNVSSDAINGFRMCSS
jgi:hypothetical protein